MEHTSARRVAGESDCDEFGWGDYLLVPPLFTLHAINELSLTFVK